MTGKTLVAGILAGLVNFALGGLLYLVLLADFMASSADRAEPGLVFIVLGEVVLGILLAWIVSLTGRLNAAGGARTGATAGVLFALGLGLVFYGAYDLYSPGQYGVDVIVWAVRWSVAGAVAGWYLGRETTTTHT